MATARPRGDQYQRDIIVGREKIKHQNNIRASLKSHGLEAKKALKNITSTGTRSGRFYTYRGRKYQASAPGEPPAKRSGRLSESFIYKSRPLELVIANTARSEDGAPYPIFLEEGTNRGLDPRPYFVHTIESLQPQLERDLYSLY